jgi:hypothetical protein
MRKTADNPGVVPGLRLACPVAHGASPEGRGVRCVTRHFEYTPLLQAIRWLDLIQFGSGSRI